MQRYGAANLWGNIMNYRTDTYAFDTFLARHADQFIVQFRTTVYHFDKASSLIGQSFGQWQTKVHATLADASKHLNKLRAYKVTHNSHKITDIDGKTIYSGRFY